MIIKTRKEFLGFSPEEKTIIIEKKEEIKRALFFATDFEDYSSLTNIKYDIGFEAVISEICKILPFMENDKEMFQEFDSDAEEDEFLSVMDDLIDYNTAPLKFTYDDYINFCADNEKSQVEIEKRARDFVEENLSCRSDSLLLDFLKENNLIEKAFDYVARKLY